MKNKNIFRKLRYIVISILFNLLQVNKTNCSKNKGVGGGGGGEVSHKKVRFLAFSQMQINFSIIDTFPFYQ